MNFFHNTQFRFRLGLNTELALQSFTSVIYMFQLGNKGNRSFLDTKKAQLIRNYSLENLIQLQLQLARFWFQIQNHLTLLNLWFSYNELTVNFNKTMFINFTISNSNVLLNIIMLYLTRGQVIVMWSLRVRAVNI